MRPAGVSWLLGAVVTIFALAAWGQTYNWHVWPLNAYIIFPLFGLLAYSLMWSHYVIGYLGSRLGWNRQDVRNYFRYSGGLVLVLICLHPGLLIIQRYRDGYGLPPGSYLTYVAPAMRWLTLLGTASLLAFLAFELRRWYGQKRWWPWVERAGDAAMLAIFYHGLRLGSSFVQDWFRVIWWLYGVGLIMILVHTNLLKLKKPRAHRAF